MAALPRITVTNTSGEQMATSLDLNQPVNVLLQQCAQQWHWDPNSVVLTYGGKILDKNQTMAYYGIAKGSTINAAGRVHGGFWIIQASCHLLFTPASILLCFYFISLYLILKVVEYVNNDASVQLPVLLVRNYSVGWIVGQTKVKKRNHHLEINEANVSVKSNWFWVYSSSFLVFSLLYSKSLST